MFISWLRHISKTAAFHSYRLLQSLLRLIQHYRSVINGREWDFRERPSLALSSQPVIDQGKPTPPSVTLAVPLLEAPPHSQGGQPGTSLQPQPPTRGELNGSPNGVACNALSPLSTPFIPVHMPKPNIYTPAGVATLGRITLIPIVPGPQISRYDRHVAIKDANTVFEVMKGPLDCSEDVAQAAVAGWEPLTHPEGALFFYHPKERVFTDADVRESVIAGKIGEAVKEAYRKVHEANIAMHPLIELALELISDDGETWGYYFADHDKRIIFWFEDHKSRPLMNKVRGVECKSHIRYALEAQYWRHVELFPNKRFLPKNVIVKLKEIVMFAQAGE